MGKKQPFFWFFFFFLLKLCFIIIVLLLPFFFNLYIFHKGWICTLDRLSCNIYRTQRSVNFFYPFFQFGIFFSISSSASLEGIRSPIHAFLLSFSLICDRVHCLGETSLSFFLTFDSPLIFIKLCLGATCLFLHIQYPHKVCAIFSDEKYRHQRKS